jgi:transcriptional regulator with XRE-family HTH domain
MSEEKLIGNIIKQVRKHLKLSQNNFGAKLNVSGSFISAVERGEKILTEDKLTFIIEEFDIPNNLSSKIKSYNLIKSPKFIMEISNETDWNKRKLAYLFSKKLNSISQDTVEKIAILLNTDKGN